MSKKEILKKVKNVVSDQLDDVDESKITLDSNIYKDFDLDSLDRFEIIDDLEDDFDIEIDADDNNLNTVGDLVNYISKAVTKKKSSINTDNKTTENS